jgi:hypothetical protein
VGWEDAAVDPLRLGDYLREFQALVDRYGYRTSLYGHFGDGCIHARINFALRTPEGLEQWRRFLREAAELVMKYGGSLSGEHGDGQAKGELLPLMYGPELMAAFRDFKRIWDPLGRMNPGKLVDATGEVRRLDQDLRLGPEYKPVTLATRFAFLSDVGDGFTRATEHCIGMGKCRAMQGGAMCPSYRATKEERYSTRGRGRLLAEMLRGEVIAEGWESEDVKEALEWCLACKSCRSECPTHTDMARYKAEFLSHYHERRGWPLRAHALGRIGEWAPLAGAVPGLANFAASTGLAKRMLGIAPQRPLPRFARRSFRAQFAGRPRAAGGEPVLLFPDTFTDHFRPQTGLAAVRVLEAAGCKVEIPRERLCCGRPYYDFGMLDRARASLERVLGVLAPQVEAGAPVLVLEPGCASVFRDELPDLLAGDARAARLAKQVVSLGELLERRGWQPPRLGGRALLHAHCHERALAGRSVKSDFTLLAAAGAMVEAPDAGCCGMSGAFGYKREHYDASVRIGEMGPLAHVRTAAGDTLIVANGFSCREQIEGLAGRPTLHLAEALARALENRGQSPISQELGSDPTRQDQEERGSDPKEIGV